MGARVSTFPLYVEEGEVTNCAGCNHLFAEGDRYIADASSGFIGRDADLDVDGLVAGIFGNTDGKVRFCEDCTEPGGDYVFETFQAESE